MSLTQGPQMHFEYLSSQVLSLRLEKNPYFAGVIIVVENGTILQIKFVVNVKDLKQIHRLAI